MIGKPSAQNGRSWRVVGSNATGSRLPESAKSSRMTAMWKSDGLALSGISGHIGREEPEGSNGR